MTISILGNIRNKQADKSINKELLNRMGKHPFQYLQIGSNKERADELIRYIHKYSRPDLVPRLCYYTLQGKELFAVQCNEVIIGKHETCDIILDEYGIDPQHLRISFCFLDRVFVLEVLGRLGCQVNGHYYGYHQKNIVLGDGDIIRVSDWETTFKQ